MNIRARAAGSGHRRAAVPAGGQLREAPRPATVERYLLALQRTAGNRAVAGLIASYAGGGSGARVSLHGNTQGNYNGGVSKVLDFEVVRAKGCECDDGPCYRASATLRVRYAVTVVIEMPEVPSGLNACQEQRVRNFLRNVLGPHEREHARRIGTYNGTTTRPYSVKACGRDAAREAAQAKAQEMHDSEADKRMKDADALSLAIDPFNRTIDLDC